MTTQTTEQVDTRLAIAAPTLVKRINRKLAHENEWEVLRTTRGGFTSRWYADLGNYYITDVERNTITASHIDIEQLGRELGVLQHFERVEYE
jgi:hypothetical protein